MAGYIPRQFTCPRAVTHPSSNRAQCRLTALIELDALTTALRRHPSKSNWAFVPVVLFPGTKHKFLTFCAMDVSFIGQFVPWSFRSPDV